MQRWDITAYTVQDLLEVDNNNMMIDHDLKVTEQMKSEQRRISWTFSDKKPALEIKPLMHTFRPYNLYGNHKGVIGLLKILVRN